MPSLPYSHRPKHSVLSVALLCVFIVTLLPACRKSRVLDHPDWGTRFKAYGIDSGCFELIDQSHEQVHVYNQARCLERFLPASTFKIFNSLVALETGVAHDDRLVIPWNGVKSRPEWNKDMDMREAFKVSNLLYYQEIARRVGRQPYQHYLDTIKYGNMKMGPAVDSFWIDGSLQISADEQAGFIKRLYFNELPFLDRTQGIVKSMMLREDSTQDKLYFKTGTGDTRRGTWLYWVVGYLERVVPTKEDPRSMNKTGVRNYPYFFALNFERPKSDSAKNWFDVRIQLLHQLLSDYRAGEKG